MKLYDMGNTATFAAIPDVVQKGIIADRTKGKTKNGETIESITFAAPISVKDKSGNENRANMAVVIHINTENNTLEAIKALDPETGMLFELSDKKETEETLLRDWPLKNGHNPRGTTTVSMDILTQESEDGKTRKSMAELDKEYDVTVHELTGAHFFVLPFSSAAKKPLQDIAAVKISTSKGHLKNFRCLRTNTRINLFSVVRALPSLSSVRLQSFFQRLP